MIENTKRLIKYGMIGGGPGGFIGEVHRKAAAMDGEIKLVAGAFSSKPEKSIEMGKNLFLDSKRVYKSYKEMAEKEADLPENKRIDFVTIVTPNYLHFPVAKEFIIRGFNIICDKPLVTTLEEAKELIELVKKHNVLFAVTYNYTGYPMVKQAKELIKQDKLGKILKVIVEFFSNYIPVNVEVDLLKKTMWRLDPDKVGLSLCLGDIGSHAENLASYITGLKIEKIFAVLRSFIPGCKLENDASILIHYENGADGVLLASQVLVGEENNLNIRVYGTKASLAWYQNDPNFLSLSFIDKPEQIFKRGNDYLESVTKHNTRLPVGHPEAFIEAFANIYRNFARTIRFKKYGVGIGPFDKDFPTIEDGFRSMFFINRALESNRLGKWVNFNS